MDGCDTFGVPSPVSLRSANKERMLGVALPRLSALILLWRRRTECVPFVSKEGSGRPETQLQCGPGMFQVAEHRILYLNPRLLRSASNAREIGLLLCAVH